MLSLLIVLFLIWLFFKMGVGIIKILGFLVAIGLLVVFFTHLVLPVLAILLVGGIVWAVIN